MNRIKTRLGEAAILLAAVLWGCISIFSRSMTAHGFTPTQTVAVRALFTALLLAVVLLIKDPKLFRIRLRDLWMFFGSGVCSFLFFNVCYMNSLVENSVSVACILMYTSPFWVLFLSVPIFKRKVHRRARSRLDDHVCGLCLCIHLSDTHPHQTRAGIRRTVRLWLCAVQHLRQDCRRTLSHDDHHLLHVFVRRHRYTADM